MHVEYLQYLIEVSNSSSISAAAKKLYLSQTSLSAIIASLEKDLNLTFFHRTHRGITVTPEGKQALEIIQDILDKNEELHQLVESTSGINRLVNVAAFPSVANILSSYLTGYFARQLPDTSLRVHELPYDRTFSAINDGLAHIAVAAENSELINIHHEMVKRGVEIEPLYQDRFYLIASSRFRLAQRERVDLSEILEERLAFTHVYPSFHDRTFAPVIRKFRLFVILNNVEAVKQAVADNNAIALVPGVAMLGDYRNELGLVRQIEVTGFASELTHYLLYEKYSMLTVAERAALEGVRDFYRMLPQSAPKL